jgi:hypothetical protein
LLAETPIPSSRKQVATGRPLETGESVDISIAVDRHFGIGFQFIGKAFARSLQVQPVQTQMDLKIILAGLVD